MLVGGSKDFHTMDKYFQLIDEFGNENVVFVSDTLNGEGQKSLIRKHSNFLKLFIIDNFTLNNLSKIGSFIRNLVKLILIPYQAYLLRDHYLNIRPKVVHAYTMYYMVLAFFAQIPYFGTVQARELVVRSKKNYLYRFFSGLAIRNAKKVMVDSNILRETMQKIFNHNPTVLKDGFNTSYSLSFQNTNFSKKRLLSVRGLQSNYQILEILKENNKSKNYYSIDFAFPFEDFNYYSLLKKHCGNKDKFLGKLNKKELYKKMSEALLTISIPDRDSSPRSVYEAIFCGSIVAVTEMPFLKELPPCMLSRIIVVDINSNSWLADAIMYSELFCNKLFVPSQEALNFCDEKFLTKKLIQEIYEIGK